MSCISATCSRLKDSLTNNLINTAPSGKKTIRLALLTLNVFAAVAPILGYLSEPQKTSLGEVGFDVSTHVLRSLTFFFNEPPQCLINTAKYMEGYRLYLIATNASHGTSTFPAVIQAGDAIVHCVSLYGAHKLDVL